MILISLALKLFKQHIVLKMYVLHFRWWNNVQCQ